MCYGNAPRSLEIARERMTAEQWAKFEADFEHFCVTSGLERWLWLLSPPDSFDWIKWAYISARPAQSGESIYQRLTQREPELWSDVSKTTFDVCAGKRRIVYAAPQPAQTERVRNAYFEKVAIASMTDEQAQMSLERWKGEAK